MIADHSVLGVIAARGGSKRVPRKNIRLVAGRPLIAWSIEQARASKYIDRLVLSTEDEEIAGVAREWGCETPFLRPASLASDDTPGADPVLHALGQLPGFDYVVLLQPTSPLRSVSDIDAAVEACVTAGAPSCVSVTSARKSRHGLYFLESNQLRPAVSSGDDRQLFSLNGAVYVARSQWLLQHETFISPQTIAYVMPPERSLDIDTEADLARFAAIASEA